MDDRPSEQRPDRVRPPRLRCLWGANRAQASGDRARPERAAGTSKSPLEMADAGPVPERVAAVDV